MIGKTLTIPGKDADDVPLYLEKQLAKLLTELKELRELIGDDARVIPTVNSNQ
ncbi:hypothetical protein N0824_03370 [Microcystis sp. 0824]|nr:hypothetical protein N0824_03370 [Microcystis sp. 0824]